MKLEDIAVRSTKKHDRPQPERPSVSLHSGNPHVQELLSRWQADQEMGCPLLNDGDLALISAVFNEVLDNPQWEPTPHIFGLICDINGRLSSWAQRA